VPDLQLVINPAGARGRGAALIVGLRTTFAF
jgi:carbohydrate-selective porin OprB